MNDFMTDDDIMSMMAEENEKQGDRPNSRGGANGKPSAASPAAEQPRAGQHVDVAALLGGRPQPGGQVPGSPGGSPADSDRSGAEGVRSRFANFFKLEESPAPGAGAGGPGDGGPKPQHLSFEQLSRATAAAAMAGGAPHPAMPTMRVATPGEIEQRLPPGMQGLQPGQGLPPGAFVAAAQSRDAGQALLAMLKQQQAAQKAAAGQGGQQQRPMPPNAVSAADVTVLEEADKVARLTALQVCTLAFP